jgi:hypothetical protein
MQHMPRGVSKRIVEACGKGQAIVVVPGPREPHLPSRVFVLEKYLKMRELPKKVRPWMARKSARISPDPLGAVEGQVLKPVRRKIIYDED